MEELIQAYKEYIEFLEREIVNTSTLSFIHGWECPQEIVEEGNKLRQKISEFSTKNKIKTNESLTIKNRTNNKRVSIL